MRARVTHTFHPLHGRELVVVDQRRSKTGDRIWYADADGRVRSLPRAWTSLAAVDPFELISAGRACFRPADLVDLAALIDGLRGLGGRGEAG